MSKEGLVDELHRYARRNYPRRKVVVRGLFDLWQADLVEMIPYSRVNGGMKYLLTVIDVCSKKAWAEPVKNKAAPTITAAMAKIFKKAGNTPKHIQADNGTEFYNVHFKALLAKSGTNLYSTHSTLKASVVERFNRTLKSTMWKKFSLRGTYKWIDILPGLVNDYNGKVHRSIGMKPIDVTEDDVETILYRLGRGEPPIPSKSRFKKGDFVRLSKIKSLFEKGYTPNWSTEVFKVVKVRHTRPDTFLLEDLKGTPVDGGFYAEELQKTTKNKKVYLVEKVLRRKGDKSYVKYLGFPSTANEWIKNSDFV